MTEEDTFNKLRRSPLQDVINYYHFLVNGIIEYQEFMEFLTKHGWNWHDFSKEYIEK